MPTTDSIRTMIHNELKDLYDAEKRLTKALPKMIKNAESDALVSALEGHLEETETHVERLEQAFEMLGETPRAKTCAAMKGLVEEAAEHMAEDYATDTLKDIAIIGSGQRVEHYEMAAYGNVIAHAAAAGLNDIAELLQQTLDEEEAADEKLTEIGEPLNQEAASGAVRA